MASVVTGIALVCLGVQPARPEPSSLSPYSLASYLRRAAAPDARDIRVNGVYGSGHYGAWQFAAHLTWRTPDGLVHGGQLTLPALVGSPPMESPFSASRLQREQFSGWSLELIDEVLDHLTNVAAPLALVDLEIPVSGPAHLITCHGDASGKGICEDLDKRSARRSTTHEQLIDLPYLDAISVQRATAMIEG